jgi:hypothetical protein
VLRIRIRDITSKSLATIFFIQNTEILCQFNATVPDPVWKSQDPELKMPDPGWKNPDPGSRINIPAQQNR